MGMSALPVGVPVRLPNALDAFGVVLANPHEPGRLHLEGSAEDVGQDFATINIQSKAGSTWVRTQPAVLLFTPLLKRKYKATGEKKGPGAF
jgi:hypothetical protein